MSEFTPSPLETARLEPDWDILKGSLDEVFARLRAKLVYDGKVYETLSLEVEEDYTSDYYSSCNCIKHQLTLTLSRTKTQSEIEAEIAAHAARAEAERKWKEEQKNLREAAELREYRRLHKKYGKGSKS